MNISQLLDQVKNIPTYELHRLTMALSQECQRPERMAAIRARLRPGMRIRYFDANQNRDIEADVLELRQTQLRVKNCDHGDEWQIHYALVNLDAVAMEPPAVSRKGLSRAELSVGQKVGFLNRQNQEVMGTVTRLNTKTATVETSTGHSWRVSYSFLFPVVAASEAAGPLIQLNSGL